MQRRAQPRTRTAGLMLELLTDELLVSVGAFLGVRDLGRLSCVATRFASKSVPEPPDPEEGAVGAGEPIRAAVPRPEGASYSLKPPVNIADAAAKRAVDRRTPVERDRRPRRPGECWLRLLAALQEGEVWARYSTSDYTVGDRGHVLTRTSAGYEGLRPALSAVGGMPMVVRLVSGAGELGTVCYVEMVILGQLCSDYELIIGVGTPVNISQF